MNRILVGSGAGMDQYASCVKKSRKDAAKRVELRPMRENSKKEFLEKKLFA
jgi:hypothetical protein